MGKVIPFPVKVISSFADRVNVDVVKEFEFKLQKDQLNRIQQHISKINNLMEELRRHVNHSKNE